MHPVLRAIGATFGAQIIVAAGTLLLLRLIATRSGTEGFAEYSLVRQGVTLLFPVVTLGLAGGLPRYIALARIREEAPPPPAYLASAFGMCAVAVLMCVGLALLAPAPTAAILFGGVDATQLVGPFAALLAATAAFHVAYGFFRGQLQVGRGNLLQIVGIGVLPPVLVIAIPGDEIDTLILAMALGLGALSVAAMLVPLARGLAQRATALRDAQRGLLEYGGRRVPGELAQVGLFALVPILAVRVTSLEDVAFLAAGVQVVSMLAVALIPIGVVLLPTLAQTWAADRPRAERQVADLCGLAAHIAVFAFVSLVLFGDLAVEAWLGSAFSEAGDIVAVTVLGAPLYAYYLMLRTTLDAASVRSYNTRTNIAALSAFAVVAAVGLALDTGRPELCVAWAFSTGIAVQGLLTMRYVHRMFGVRTASYSLSKLVPIAVALGAVAYALRPPVAGSSSVLALLLLVELLLALGYFGMLWRARVPWSRTLGELLRSSGRFSPRLRR